MGNLVVTLESLRSYKVNAPIGCAVQASQPGSAEWLPASTVTRTLVVDRAAIVLTATATLSATGGWSVTVTAQPGGVATYIWIMSKSHAIVTPSKGPGTSATFTVTTDPANSGTPSVTFFPDGDLVGSFTGTALIWNAPAG